MQMVEGCLDLRPFLWGAVGETAGFLLLACVELLEIRGTRVGICVFGFCLEKWLLGDDISSWLSTQDSSRALIPSQGGWSPSAKARVGGACF